MKKILKSWLLFAALCTCATAVAERPILIHSHNDYCRRAPFWQAYAQQVYSIEADVFLHGGKLLVGVRLFDVYRDPVRVGVGKKSMAFALTYRADDHTLTSEEVERAHSKLVTKVCKATGGEVRS